ncbi:MAG: squalene--hopene cyclase [Pirellulaceae bacterium]|nr:squalene--hopene cyclase [Pirellulaceae bacterium]
MRQHILTTGLCLIFLAGPALTLLQAADPVTLDNVVDPGPNSPLEPLAERFSLDRAVQFLDSAALQWQKERKCCTCHTNYAYLYTRPAIGHAAAAHGQVRTFAEQLVEQRWPDKGPRWDAEVVATAAALAHNDAATTGTLHQATRAALDRMWTLQRSDGGWNWLKCDWPPMESDDDYGVVLAALAAGVAPEKYAESPAARQGLDGIRRYLQANPPPTLHHRMMVLWAARYLPDLMTAQQKQACVSEMLERQNPDGGWSLAALGNWQRDDGSPQDLQSSDGYGTGFVIYALRMADIAAGHEAIERGVAWLKTHQRQSGRWFTRSLHRDSRHFITHAGTAMAVLALTACETPPRENRP